MIFACKSSSCFCPVSFMMLLTSTARLFSLRPVNNTDTSTRHRPCRKLRLTYFFLVSISPLQPTVDVAFLTARVSLGTPLGVLNARKRSKQVLSGALMAHVVFVCRHRCLSQDFLRRKADVSTSIAQILCQSITCAVLRECVLWR